MLTRSLTIYCPGGLHAQVAAHLASLARDFASSLFLMAPGGSVSLADLLGMVGLALPEGASVTLLADGRDEAAALEAVARVLAEKE